MKKIHLYVFGGIISILIIISGCAGTPQHITHQIAIQNASCERLVSIENDESMPKDSLTQRYKVQCENNGKTKKLTLEITVDNKGEIKETKILNSTKAMPRPNIFLTPMSDLCEKGQKLRCITICEFPQGREPFCYYICVCTDN